MRTARTLITLAALLAPLAAPTPTPALPVRHETAQPALVDLRPKFEKGQEHRFTMELDSTTDMTAGGGESTKQSMKQEYGLLFRVIEAAPESGATAEVVFETIKATIDSPLGKETFDSTKPADQDGQSMLAPVLRQAVGTTLTLKFDADGNITSVTGGEGLALAASLGGGGGPKDLLGGIFSVKKGSGRARVGETWTNIDTIADSPAGGLKLTTEHTLKSAARGEAVVAFRGRVEPGTQAAAGPVKLTDAHHEGRYVWDTRDGMLKSLESELAVTMDVSAPGVDAATTSRTSMRVKRTP